MPRLYILVVEKGFEKQEMPKKKKKATLAGEKLLDGDRGDKYWLLTIERLENGQEVKWSSGNGWAHTQKRGKNSQGQIHKEWTVAVNGDVFCSRIGLKGFCPKIQIHRVIAWLFGQKTYANGPKRIASFPQSAHNCKK